jgi:hypothetical protein
MEVRTNAMYLFTTARGPRLGMRRLSLATPAQALCVAVSVLFLAAACSSSPGASAPPASPGAGSSAAPSASAGSPGTGGQANPGASTSPFQEMLAYSACMRANGVTNFPDPVQNANGSFSLQLSPSLGINPNSTQYKAAQQACQHLMPSGVASGQGSTSPEQAVKWAACMRSHGLPNFPDPTVSNGVAQLNLSGTNIDPNSSQFQSASQACQSLRPTQMMFRTSGSQP